MHNGGVANKTKSAVNFNEPKMTDLGTQQLNYCKQSYDREVNKYGVQKSTSWHSSNHASFHTILTISLFFSHLRSCIYKNFINAGKILSWKNNWHWQQNTDAVKFRQCDIPK